MGFNYTFEPVRVNQRQFIPKVYFFGKPKIFKK
ncbi:hypothetical protein BROSI_A1075 [Candidatus Brocadia sinica JPN1]|uniref:Uncharacterized protein n=1 Tax=Candidatus Brocadia sinica JPN1 TaxID=1197129 RepID=A0ABQ0JV11_9BACT|nr:hypothetical protein BROSI_A1075 [Candidatus Brocadia sinica JPN1]